MKRNLLGIVKFTKSSAVERFCRDALAEHARLFRLWHKFRSDQIDRGQLLLRSIPIQKRIFALAERHLDSPHREVRNIAMALFEHNQRLFTFLEHDGVEPGMAVDGNGNTYLTGSVTSPDLPGPAGGFQSAKKGFGTFRSSDHGANWGNPNAGLGSLRVEAIAVDPGNPAIVYAGTANGVYKSVNSGVDWILAPPSLPAARLCSTPSPGKCEPC